MPRPLLYQYLSFSLFSSLFLSLCFLCKGLPLKDENGHEHEHKHEHEPLVQARQHRTAIANGMSSGGMGGVGIRHHGGARMSPLEIGMYVLLAAFCFAIVVFVVSCVVYASKFKPQPPDSPLAGSALPVLSGAARARAAANQLASGRRPPRESTTNAHDWVWLGRATDLIESNVAEFRFMNETSTVSTVKLFLREKGRVSIFNEFSRNNEATLLDGDRLNRKKKREKEKEKAVDKRIPIKVCAQVRTRVHTCGQIMLETAALLDAI